jgi:flagellar basal-body rod protein FlgC
MVSATSISGSALQAYGTSLQVTANNMANLNTDNFKASRATFQENKAGGVNVSVAGTQDSVDISREATNLLSDRNSFKANLNVIKTADDMTKDLLSIKA